MSEFALIDRIRRRALTRDDVILGIGDDAAVLQVPAGVQLVVAMDTLNAGVHFPLDTAPADIGWKALAVNLSDLAAMGAQPAWCTLSLSLPCADAAWLDGFLDGFLALAAQHRVALVGGDTTRGPLSICVTVHGFVAPGRALRRDGAQVDDDVWVTGTLGDAAGALALLLPVAAANAGAADCAHVARAKGPSPSPPLPPLPFTGEGWGEGSEPHEIRTADAANSPARAAFAALRVRLDRPTPRVAIGLALAGIANAAVDISDGLLADLGHLCTASGVGAHIALAALPTSDALRGHFDADRRRALQATGGDDYELCFTAPATARAALECLAIDTADTAIGLTRIGRIVAAPGVVARDPDGHAWDPSRSGHEHFTAQ